MKTLIVLPVIDLGAGLDCLATMHSSIREHVLVIDNCACSMGRLRHWGVRVERYEHNIGVGRSWNRGVGLARSEGYDFLLLLSAQIRFGSSRGRDISHLEEIASKWGVLPAPTFWHTAFTALEWWDRVGLVDEHWYPAYYEDTDLKRRALIADAVIPDVAMIPDACLDAWSTGGGHGVERLRNDHPGLPTINYEGLKDYWRAKWGCEVEDALDLTAGFTHPFNNLDADWTWWPPVSSIAELRAHYGIVGH